MEDLLDMKTLHLLPYVLCYVPKLLLLLLLPILPLIMFFGLISTFHNLVQPPLSHLVESPHIHLLQSLYSNVVESPCSRLLQPLTVISYHVEPIQVVGDLQLDSYSETAVGPVMLYVQRTPIAATAAAASGAQAGKYDIVAVLTKRQIL